MFQQVKVAVIPMVENMSWLQCPHCDERIDVFSNGGGKRTAEAMSIHVLGSLPLDPQCSDWRGYRHPVATAGPEDARGGIFYTLAEAVMERAKEAAGISGPTMTVSD